MKVAAALFVAACFVPVLAQSTPANTVRDPFVYQLRAPERTVVQPQVIVARPEKQPVTEVADQPRQTPEVKPAAPAVTVTGIVSGPSQTAILSNAAGSYLVRVGDRLGDYRVSAIGPRSVTLATGANRFKLPLD